MLPANILVFDKTS